LLDDRFEEIRSDFNDREPDIPRNHCQVASEGGRR
jgi:hypothetical protein